jgi:hypothetical protein
MLGGREVGSGIETAVEVEDRILQLGQKPYEYDFGSDCRLKLGDIGECAKTYWTSRNTVFLINMTVEALHYAEISWLETDLQPRFRFSESVF